MGNITEADRAQKDLKEKNLHTSFYFTLKNKTKQKLGVNKNYHRTNAYSSTFKDSFLLQAGEQATEPFPQGALLVEAHTSWKVQW